MSRRTSSGSRFEALPIEGEEEGGEGSQSSGSSIGEMKLSKDFYQAAIPGAQSSSDSSAEEMKLSRDNYPVALPTELPGQSEGEDINRFLPAIMSPGTSGSHSDSQKRSIKSRALKSIPEATEEPSDLVFIWDHFRRESQLFDEVGVDALDDLFGKKSDKSQSSSQAGDISKNIQEDVRILKDIGFNIDYPKGMLGEGFFGVVYQGHYGTEVSRKYNFKN